MNIDYETLKFIWWILIGVLLIAFAITGGFDLGVGTLLPFIGKTDTDRRVILNSIGPTWDGNQVWFLTAGGAIFAAWPMVYAAAFSGFYLALLLVLFALILRPPGIDYRSKLPSPRWRTFWDWTLFCSGAIPSLIFGVAFGNLLLGLPFHYDNSLLPHYTGNFFELLHPFALLTGIVSLSMLTMQGALFLQLKTTASLQQRAQKAIKIFGILFIIVFAGAGIWAIFALDGFRIISIPDLNSSFSPIHKTVAISKGAWLDTYKKFPVAYGCPMLALLGTVCTICCSIKNRPCLGLICNSMVSASTILTAAIALFPFILPSATAPQHSLTIWDATSSKHTLTWMFWVVIIFLPIVLSYTIWVYKIFSGKVLADKVLKTNSSY